MPNHFKDKVVLLYMEHPWLEKNIIEHSQLLTKSFSFWTKRELIEEVSDPVDNAFLLYHAPLVLVSHGTEQDPIFNYANKKAQELWKINWDNFIKLPSKFSVEPIEQEERNRLLHEASKNGVVSNYNGTRIASDGKKFRIKDTILWNLTDEKGKYLGQAAMFQNWEFI